MCELRLDHFFRQRVSLFDPVLVLKHTFHLFGALLECFLQTITLLLRITFPHPLQRLQSCCSLPLHLHSTPLCRLHRHS